MSDITIEIYAMDSGLLRALKSIETSGEEQSRLKTNMVTLYANDAMERIVANARQVLGSIETGDALQGQLEIVRKLSDFTPINSAQVKNEIADEIIEVGRYTC